MTVFSRNIVVETKSTGTCLTASILSTINMTIFGIVNYSKYPIVCQLLSTSKNKSNLLLLLDFCLFEIDYE